MSSTYCAWYQEVLNSVLLLQLDISVKKGQDKVQEKFMKNAHTTVPKGADLQVIKGKMDWRKGFSSGRMTQEHPSARPILDSVGPTRGGGGGERPTAEGRAPPGGREPRVLPPHLLTPGRGRGRSLRRRLPSAASQLSRPAPTGPPPHSLPPPNSGRPHGLPRVPPARLQGGQECEQFRGDQAQGRCPGRGASSLWLRESSVGSGPERSSAPGPARAPPAPGVTPTVCPESCPDPTRSSGAPGAPPPAPTAELGALLSPQRLGRDKGGRPHLRPTYLGVRPRPPALPGCPLAAAAGTQPRASPRPPTTCCFWQEDPNLRSPARQGRH
ncbi:PREDICTED: basic proline-rich protein-like [Elephantulus edwardii]|uniref:basic proline-rich protein-like n=1 Tax=Elephantulus edwardii TaxID=28737 RepID=UPI0003F0C4A0|nr:PREDICTED: basic proline-rich protein-like [Elephantulus edwardii]